MDKQKIGFIGLGLIGGSIAKAIRQYFPDYEIVAFDKNKEALALATQESVIDVAATTIDDNFYHCSYIFLCAPVSFNSAYLKQLTCYMHEDCILTDVGKQTSTKRQKLWGLVNILSEDILWQVPRRAVTAIPKQCSLKMLTMC